MNADPQAPAAGAAIIWTFLSLMFDQMHTMSAIGASFGCLAFIMLPDPVVAKWSGVTDWVFSLLRKVLLTIVSWGVGYSTGYAFSNNASMLMAILGGCVGAAVLGVMNLMVKNDGDLPPWMNSAISAVLRLKRGTDE